MPATTATITTEAFDPDGSAVSYPYEIRLVSTKVSEGLFARYEKIYSITDASTTMTVVHGSYDVYITPKGGKEHQQNSKPIVVNADASIFSLINPA